MKYTLSLKEHRRFKYTIKKGKFSIQKCLTMYISNNHNQCNFLGICVSKKNGNSVYRNKFKRWVRESYKNEEKSLKKGFNVVVILKKSIIINEIDYHIVESDIKSALNNLNLYE